MKKTDRKLAESYTHYYLDPHNRKEGTTYKKDGIFWDGIFCAQCCEYMGKEKGLKDFLAHLLRSKRAEFAVSPNPIGGS